MAFIQLELLRFLVDPRYQVDKAQTTTLGSLSNNVFERRTSTGSGLFSFFDGGFAQIFSQIASIKVKKLRNTNFISSRHVKRENTSLPVDVRRSKTSLLKLPIKRGLRALKLSRACSHYFLSFGYRADCGGIHGTHLIK